VPTSAALAACIVQHLITTSYLVTTLTEVWTGVRESCSRLLTTKVVSQVCTFALLHAFVMLILICKCNIKRSFATRGLFGTPITSWTTVL
jgi:hypothetical protein